MDSRSISLRLFDWSGKHAIGDDLLHGCVLRLIHEACRLENTVPALRRFCGYRASVLGGGTIFGHGVFFSRVARRIAFDNVPYIVFCSGVRDPGRPLTPVETDRLNRFCNHATGIGVRGVHSRQWLVRQGIMNAEVIGDAALSFIPDPTPTLPGDFKVGVCLRFMRGGLRHEEQASTNEKNIDLFARLCDEIVSQFSASLFFFDFSKNRFDDDGLAIRKVLSLMKNRSGASHARIFSFHDNMDPVIAFSRLGRLDFTISQRLHPALVSWISAVPALSLEYQFDKAADAFSPLELPQAVVSINRPDCDYILQTMATILSNKSQLISKVIYNAGIYRQRQIGFMRRFIQQLTRVNDK